MDPILDGDGSGVSRDAVGSEPSAGADSSSFHTDAPDQAALAEPAETGWPQLSGFELDVCLAAARREAPARQRER